MALRLMRKYAEQAGSFTDCLSFALMKRENIKHVFGFDRHFEAAGFQLWPPELERMKDEDGGMKDERNRRRR